MPFPHRMHEGWIFYLIPSSSAVRHRSKKNMFKKLLQELDVFRLLFLDIAKVYTGVCQMGTVTLLVLTSAIFPKFFLFFLDSLLENV